MWRHILNKLIGSKIEAQTYKFITLPSNLFKMICATLLFSLASAHGFMMHPGPISEAIKRPAVRNYGLINYQIDELRNPTAITQAAAFSDNSKLCRNTGPGRKIAITLTNGQPFTITQAFSIGAQHIGPCRIQIMQQGDPSSAVNIASASANGGCARPPVAQFDTNKSPPSAAHQCPGKIPPGLVTDDMCMHEWTFTVRNADKIKCTDCVMRWQWAGEHMFPNREEFESCVDVTITRGQGGYKDNLKQSSANHTVVAANNSRVPSLTVKDKVAIMPKCSKVGKLPVKPQLLANRPKMRTKKSAY